MSGELDKTKELLEVKKLALEIADLRRPHWLRPGVVIPILAALGTLAVSQYVGVFDVARQRIEVANDKALMAKERLQQDIERIAAERMTLEGEKTRLATEKNDLGKQISNMKRDVAELRNRAASALSQAKVARNELNLTYAGLHQITVDQTINKMVETCAGPEVTASFEVDALMAGKPVIDLIQGDLGQCFAKHIDQIPLLAKLRKTDRVEIEAALTKASIDITVERRSLIEEARNIEGINRNEFGALYDELRRRGEDKTNNVEWTKSVLTLMINISKAGTSLSKRYERLVASRLEALRDLRPKQ